MERHRSKPASVPERPDEGAEAAEGRHAPQGGPPPTGERALRLDKRTYLDSGRYRVILRAYGDGLAEIGWSFIPVGVPAKSGRGEAADREQHEERAIRRARSRLRQLVLAGRADHLLTLTYRANVTDFAQACSDLCRFVRIVRRQVQGWLYVAVPEQQKRGAWHWHLAVCGRQDVQVLRAAWRRVVGDGNIDVKPPRRSAQHRMLALVRYLSKYLAKGFDADARTLNGRRFRASHGIDIPAQSIPVPTSERANVRGFALDQLVREAGRVGFVWDAEDTRAGWACSWD